jgi:hypothetical protein
MPVMDVELTQPRFFEGLYAGFYLGATGNERHNFVPVGVGQYYGGGLVVGYNYYLNDDVVVGAEVRGGAASDFSGTQIFDLFALAHLGFPIIDGVMPYYIGGIGWFQSAPAYALGVGVEVGVFDNVGLHYEVMARGALGPTPGPVQYPGISGWQISGGLVWHFGEGGDANVVEQFLRPRYDYTAFTGLYATMTFGAYHNPPWNFFPNTGQGLHPTRGSYGASVGWNQEIADNILAGVELHGGFLFDTSGDTTSELLALGKVGLRPVDGLFVYSEGGVGLLQGRGMYAVGAGVEWAAFGRGGFRTDVLAVGELAPATPANAGFTAVRILAGPTWHFD